MHQNIK